MGEPGGGVVPRGDAMVACSELAPGEIIVVDGRQVTVTRIEFPVAYLDAEQNEVSGIGIWYAGGSASGVLRCPSDRLIQRVT